MSLKIDRVQLEIVIQQDSARQKLMELEGNMKQIRKEMRGMKEGTDEWVKKSEELKKVQKEYDSLFDKIGIGSLSVTELRNRQKELNAILNKLPGDSPLYKQYKQQLDDINLRMKELKGNAVETNISLSKMADGFNRYAALGASVVASLTGVALTARKCVDEYASMQEAESQVRKYTGMTAEEVSALNEEFKKMDTRTAREALNGLAGDAGRLGITGSGDVMEFVEAANMINVALGEDLGEDAVKNIGKLAQMFGEDKSMGLRGAMLATGSAVNELAQNSSAAEGYLVGFTARVAGAANQANISQASIMGYASVLDQNMQQQEMAATAFQTLMMKVFQDPAKFAKLAGKNVEEFTKLIKEDANEALLQFLETLNQKGGLDKLAPMFKEMGLDGVRASGVISTMAGKLGDIRAAQDLANQAYKDGTSIIKEYNVQNNTVQAELDKAKKRFTDVRVELGEKLLPLMRYMISTGSMTVKGLSSIVSAFLKYKTVILTVTAIIAGYTIATHASTVADKLKVFWTDKVIVGLKRLYATMLAHPWGVVLAAAATFIAYYRDMTKAISEVDRVERSLQDIRRKSTEAVQAEKDEISQLLKIAKDETLSKEKREAAIRRLNEISPEYLGNITLEKINTEEATGAINSYIDSLLILEEIKHSQSKINELKDRKDDIGKNGVDNGFWETVEAKSAYILNSMKTSIGLYSDAWADNVLDKFINKGVNELRSIDREIQTINGNIEASRQKLLDIDAKRKETTNGNGGGGGGNNDKTGNPWDNEMHQLETKARQEQNKLKEQLYHDDNYTEEQYRQDSYKKGIAFLLLKKALLEKYQQDTSEIQGQLYDKMIAESDRVHKMNLDAEKKAQEELKRAKDEQKKSQDEDLKALDSTYQADKTALKQAYLDGDIKTEKEFQEKMKELERDYLQSRLTTLEKFGEDTAKVAEQIADQGLNDAKDTKENEKNTQEKKLDTTVGKDGKLAILQAMYDADLISYEEYEKRKTEITDEHEKARDEKVKASFDAIGKAAQAAGDIVNAMMDREISKVNLRYDKQIKAAKKAGKDTSKLEEAKEEEINAIRKKYADKQFMAAVLQVTATTAVAAMESFKAMAGIPVVGPALGAIAAAAAIASGAAQIQVAKQQRDEAKGLYEGGYGYDYVEGYTSSGNPEEVAGVIPVHKNEFVTNHYGVANPHVRQFLDVFDVAQKNGTIRMINTTQILEQVKTRSGRYTGGYSAEDLPTAGKGWTNNPGTSSGGEQMQRVIGLLQESNQLLAVISKKELNIDGRAVRDRIRQIDQLEKNVSR